MGLRGIVGAVFLMFALSVDARAAAPDGNYYSPLFGCADFVGKYSAEIAARNAIRGGGGDRLYTLEFIAAYHYVLGWLSAFNALTPDTFNIVPTGANGAMLWLNNYCAKNPLKNLDAGLQALVEEAYPSRQQNRPGQ